MVGRVDQRVDVNSWVVLTAGNFHVLDVDGGIQSRAVRDKATVGVILGGHHGAAVFKLGLNLTLDTSAREGGGFIFLCASTREGTV